MERRNTRQRQLVLDAVKELHNHPTADDVFLNLRTRDSKISRGTVYRNLHLLAENGDILSVRFDGTEHFDSRLDEHAHLVCSDCGKLIDIPAPSNSELCERIGAETGYSDLYCTTTLIGICPECQAKIAE